MNYEKYQVEILKKYGVFEEYLKRRYDYYMTNWYLEKLKFVSDEKEKILSEKIIKEIKLLYGDFSN